MALVIYTFLIWHLLPLRKYMNVVMANRFSRKAQYVFTLLAIVTVSGICYFFSPFLDYKVVALLLLLSVSLIAITFDILPVLIAALSSALIWDFFFIPPRFTFHINNTEDLILFVMYFIIAMVNAVLTYKIRQVEKIARKKEDKANSVKLYDTLLNSLSHELRTPIATIIGATDTLQMQNANLTAFDKGELLHEISKASLRLNQQVENLLNMSRLESGFLKPNNDWCDINEVAYSVIKMMDENKYTQKITVNINPHLPLFRLDKGMLQQILYNLVNNACLYTPSHSEVQVIALCHSKVLEIIIEDNGPGFAEEELSKVFEKFYRPKNTKTGGTGLGLSIVKGFTEALGGTVQLHNIPTGGCRFVINIRAESTHINKKREPWLIRKY